MSVSGSLVAGNGHEPVYISERTRCVIGSRRPCWGPQPGGRIAVDRHDRALCVRRILPATNSLAALIRTCGVLCEAPSQLRSLCVRF